MKTDVEELSPTRVRLSVEVSFEELKPSLDKAYKEVAQQARIPGFRPGKVPPRVIDMRIGRGAVLSEAVNDALPEFYSKAVQEADVFALGQPEVEITQLDDGKELTFTAEVEVRPKFELPDFATLSVTVDNAEVTDEDVEEYLNNLRERFASLKTAQRPAEDGDYTTIDLSASLDGELIEDAQATSQSYQIGSGTMLDGLDEALAGLSAGESATFKSELAGGAAEGQEADITVTVQAVKVKELPELDDDFAQLASEFDTLDELKEDTRKQLERVKKLQQTTQARDKAVEALVDAIDIPLPEKFVEHELHHAQREHRQPARPDADVQGGLPHVDREDGGGVRHRPGRAVAAQRQGQLRPRRAGPHREPLGEPGRAVLLRRRPGAADGRQPGLLRPAARRRTTRSTSRSPRCCAARRPRSPLSGSRSPTRRATRSTSRRRSRRSTPTSTRCSPPRPLSRRRPRATSRSATSRSTWPARSRRTRSRSGRGIAEEIAAEAEVVEEAEEIKDSEA